MYALSLASGVWAVNPLMQGKRRMSEDRIERDLRNEEFRRKLLETGQLWVPDGAVVHNLGLSAWLGVEPHNREASVYARAIRDRRQQAAGAARVPARDSLPTGAAPAGERAGQADRKVRIDHSSSPTPAADSRPVLPTSPATAPLDPTSPV